jgi:hypothetical protein
MIVVFLNPSFQNGLSIANHGFISCGICQESNPTVGKDCCSEISNNVRTLIISICLLKSLYISRRYIQILFIKTCLMSFMEVCI